MSVYNQVQKNRDRILEIAAEHGAYKIKLFGSVVRGEDKSDSDIDFLVEFEQNRSLIDHIALKQDLEDLLGHKVDVVTEGSLHWYLKENVQKEAVSI